ncbi:MAG: hypothetical protein LBQ86_07050 [Holophagales bacterium]|nr:hypothetical protein [Holophagales bacterium]
MRDTDVAPKCVARRDHALAATNYFKIAGRNFEVELELNAQIQSRVFNRAGGIGQDKSGKGHASVDDCHRR